jgi:hypothetical protein
LGLDKEIMITSTANENIWYDAILKENIVHVQSGFLGHENDANWYRQIGFIGPDAHLKFSAVTFLETVFICPFWCHYSTVDPNCQSQKGIWIGHLDFLTFVETVN